MNSKRPFPSRQSGFTLVEIMIVVAIIGLLASIAIPSFIRARKNTNRNLCTNNLRILADAAQELRLERPADPVDAPHIQPYLGRELPGGTMPRCPVGGTYDYLDTIPTCSSQEAGFEHTLPY
jgi:prepilin-type N-terminal cleavage/methylation domain-containing protein